MLLLFLSYFYPNNYPNKAVKPSQLVYTLRMDMSMKVLYMVARLRCPSIALTPHFKYNDPRCNHMIYHRHQMIMVCNVLHWEHFYNSRLQNTATMLSIPYRNGTCESHVKFQKHMWFFTCETHVHSWGVSHVKFHMWLFTCVSHVKFHMWYFTCEISHVKFHIWNFTCEISYLNCHMWYFTCEQSYIIKLCNFICQSSHGKIHMWYSPCEFSKVKFLMVGQFSCEISPMTSFCMQLYV